VKAVRLTLRAIGPGWVVYDNSSGGVVKRVLRSLRVVRGVVASVALATGLLWAPSSALAAMWTRGQTSMDPHVAGVSVKLPDGQVLLAGGGVNTRVSESGELLPANGTGPFLPGGTMTQARLYAAGALLHDGDVLIAGGNTSWTQDTEVPPTAEVWRPHGGSGTFKATGSMHVPRQAFTLTTLPNGQALAVGGSPFLGTGAGSATAELYHPATNEWTLTGSMPSGRLGHTATLLPDCKVLIVGDAHQALLYDYATGEFSPTGGEGEDPTFQRSYQTATLLADGKVLIAGGVTGDNVPVASASVYDPATGTFTPTANEMSTPRSQGFAARLADGQVIVGGGFTDPSRTTITDTVDIYNPETNSWSATEPLPSGSFAETAAQTLHEGHVSVMNLRNGRHTEIYTPDKGKPVSPPAQNCSDLFSIVSTQTAAEGEITLQVAVPHAGSLEGTGTVPAQSGVADSFPYGSVSHSAKHSGMFTLTIKPDQQAKDVLQSEGTLQVDLAVTFTQKHKNPLLRSSTATAHWS
jgi:hypothetical protein